jgi:Alpha amylase, catalytic domain
MRRLDYLHGLGVTAIWLMPFQTSPHRDDGYDVSDYYGVDRRYGTFGDFVEFTHGAKQRGIRVIIDLVVNHTSNEHAWFKEARRDPNSKYRDWYVWSKKKPPRAKEGMVFPGVQQSTWSYDEQAKAWYFHRFYDFQPDLNTSNPEVQAIRHCHQGFQGAQAGRAIRHAPQLPRIPAMAAGRLHHSRRSQRVAGDQHGIFRSGRRPHAHDVQFPG